MAKGKKQARRLAIRQADYARMIGQRVIGTGKRGVNGYRRPGSNKK